MGGGSLPPNPKVSAVPQIIDPTVMFARMREKAKALQRTGRESTILTNPYPKQTLGAATLLGGTP